MVDKSSLKSGPGSIRWGRVGEVLTGGVIGAVLVGFSEIVLALFDIPIAVLEGGAEFGSELVSVLIGIPLSLLSGTPQQTFGLIRESGPLAFVVAVGIYVATLYVLAQGVSRVV